VGRQPGETAVYRFIRNAKVRAAMPTRVVRDEDSLVALYLPIGAGAKWAIGDGRPIRGQADLDWELRDHLWHTRNVLLLIRPGDWYSLELLWDDGGRFTGWYVNIQEPLRRSPIGFDTDDLILDLVVQPDGSSAWKDEDELAEAVVLGRFSEPEAAEVRRIGERVVASKPWPTGWEDWRPDAGWPVPTLPGDWARVDE
jgi:hypothetical protein